MQEVVGLGPCIAAEALAQRGASDGGAVGRDEALDQRQIVVTQLDARAIGCDHLACGAIEPPHRGLRTAGLDPPVNRFDRQRHLLEAHRLHQVHVRAGSQHRLEHVRPDTS